MVMKGASGTGQKLVSPWSEVPYELSEAHLTLSTSQLPTGRAMSLQKQARDYSRASLLSRAYREGGKHHAEPRSQTRPQTPQPFPTFSSGGPVWAGVSLSWLDLRTLRGAGIGTWGERDIVTYHSVQPPTPTSSYLPSQAGYLGQLPLDRGVLWVVEIWLPMLVLQLYPLWTQEWSGPSA